MNSVIINFSIYCPVENVEKMKIVGNTDLLGKWQPENGFPLTKENNENNKWSSLEPIIVEENNSLEFKLCLWEQGSTQVTWEPLPYSNHKIQAKGNTMNLTWEFGYLNILNNCEGTPMGNSDQEWKNKYQQMVGISKEKEIAQQNEIKELKSALENEKKDSEEVRKQIIKLKEETPKGESYNFEKELVTELQGVNDKLQKEFNQLTEKCQKDKETNDKEMQKLVKSHEEATKAKDNEITKLKQENINQESQIKEATKAKDNEITKLKQENADQQKSLDDAKLNVQKTTNETNEFKKQIEDLKKQVSDLIAASSNQAPQAKLEEVNKEQVAQGQEQEEPEKKKGKKKKPKQNN